MPPVVWRTGIRSTEPHLLALGHPGSGASTLLRSIALQVLRFGDVLIVDGGGTGEYACLTGRDGVLAVECSLPGALASLEWAAQETERRLIAINLARQAGDPPPPTPAALCGSCWTAPPSSPIWPWRTAARTRSRCCGCRCGTAGPRT